MESSSQVVPLLVSLSELEACFSKGTAQAGGRIVLPIADHPRSTGTLQLFIEAGMPVERLGAISELLWDPQPSNIASLSDSLVLGVGSVMAAPAALFAKLARRRFKACGEITEIYAHFREERASSITLFALRQTLTSPIVDSILTWSCENSPVGIVTGAGLVDAYNWIVRWCLRNYLYREHNGVLALARTPIAYAELALPIRVLSESQKLTEAEHTGRYATIVHELHSRETCAKWGAKVLCGLQPQLHDVEMPITSPSCGQGKSCLWKDKQRVGIGTLNATHHIALSCGALRLGNNLMDPRAGLGLSIFGGTSRSLLASYRFITTDDWLGPYLTDLIISGLNMGSVTVEANRYLQSARSDMPAFVLLGDPEDELDAWAISDSLGGPEQKGTESTREIPCGWVTGGAADVNVYSGSPFVALGNSRVAGSDWPMPIVSNQSREWVEKQDIGQYSEVPKELLTIAEFAWRDCHTGMWLTLEYQSRKENGRVVGKRTCPVCDDPVVIHCNTTKSPRTMRDVWICARCGIVVDCAHGSGPWLEFAREVSDSGNVLNLSVRCRVENRVASAFVCLSLQHARQWGWDAWPRLLHSGPIGTDQEWKITTSIPSLFPSFAIHIRVWGMFDGIPFFLSRPWVRNHDGACDE